MKKLILTFTCVLGVTVATVTHASNGALSQGFGHSLEEWQELYFTWYLGGDQSNPEGNVYFLPIPAGEPDDGAGTPEDPTFFVGHEDVTLTEDLAFMLPVWAYVGETYQQQSKPDDEPLPAEVFTGSEVLIALDGRSLIDSAKDDLSKFYAEPVYFTPPIAYDEPRNRGSSGRATAAIFVQGLGVLHGPLDPGDHSLSLFVDTGFGFGFINTWDIHVE